MRHYNIPVFVPHKGCPNDCVFCNQKKITGQQEGSPDEAEKIIEEHLSTMERPYFAEIAFFGGSFTGIELSLQKKYLEIAKKFVDSGDVDGIRLSTRPDYISAEILDMLKSYGVTAVELGAQSMDDGVLRKNHRGHSADDTKKAVTLLKEYGFETGLQMMTGMYGSDAKTDLFTGMEIAKLSPDTVRIYPTIVLSDTMLEKLFESGEYIPPSLDESVEVCAKLHGIFDEKGIKIIRTGLQSTDTICEKGNIVAGAYHSAFGELVLSRIFRDEMEEKVKNGEKVIFVPKKQLSVAIGQKKTNIKYFKEKYGVDIEVKSI
ncbi:MAG: radical SAM protein [Clostridia bacterium]|nr:radical SAM protein [Clostridia bacterium]